MLTFSTGRVGLRDSTEALAAQATPNLHEAETAAVQRLRAAGVQVHGRASQPPKKSTLKPREGKRGRGCWTQLTSAGGSSDQVPVGTRSHFVDVL